MPTKDKTECPICHKTVWLTESTPPKRPTLKGHLLWGHPQLDIVNLYLNLTWEIQQEKLAD